MIAAEVTQRFPQITAEIVNLDDPCTVKPDNIFAVPTYVLDGDVISLGNPYRDHLFVKIGNALSGKTSLKP